MDVDNDSAISSIKNVIKDLDELCASDDLSLTTLQEKLEQLPSIVIECTEYKNYYDEYPFLHSACKNKNATLEIIQRLLDKFSQVAELYAIYGTSTEKGLPIHFYLSPTIDVVNIDIVKVLVKAYPQALLISDKFFSFTPLQVLLYNRNIDNLLEVVMFLLEAGPSSIRMVNKHQRTPLHVVCSCVNKKVNLAVVQYIYYQWPDACRMRDARGYLPADHLLLTETDYDYKDDEVDILQFMISVDPTFLREDNIKGKIPIYKAVTNKSTKFCKVLIDAYPESLRIESYRRLPIHTACESERADAADTVQYMLEIDPDSIDIEQGGGWYPIHMAASYGRTKIVEMILQHDKNESKKKGGDECWLPLHIACAARTKTKGHLETVQILYDAYPEGASVIENTSYMGNGYDGHTPCGLVCKDLSYDEYKTSDIINFFDKQKEYAGVANDHYVSEYPGNRPTRFRKSEDVEAMTTLDENGWAPLHHALKDGASLGSIKLLAGGNPPLGIRTAAYNMAFPLHIACEFSSIKVVKYLVELDVSGGILKHQDAKKDSVLHYACRGGNLEVIQYLLKQCLSLISEKNVNSKLPIHMLCEAGKDKVECESTEYIETIWLMLLAKPDAIMSMGSDN